MSPDLLEQGQERLRAASGPGYGRVVLPGQLDLAHGRILYLEEMWIAVYWFMREVAMPNLTGYAAGEQPPTPAQRQVRDYTRQNYDQTIYNPFNKGWGGGKKGGGKKGGAPPAWSPMQPWGGWTQACGGGWGKGSPVYWQS